MAASLTHLENFSPAFRKVVEIIATLGQCTFPIFVMHFVAWCVKPVLVGFGLSDPEAMVLLLTAFIGFSAWCVSSPFRLHYANADSK